MKRFIAALLVLFAIAGSAMAGSRFDQVLPVPIPFSFGGTNATSAAWAPTSIAINGCTIGSAFLCVTPTAAATLTTALNQVSGGSALLAFTATTGVVVGQTVSGTNIPLGDQVSSIVATGSSLTANGVSNSGQKVLTTTNTTGAVQGQQCVDITTPTAIGDGNVIASVQAGVSITMTTNLVANTANNDAITCDPVVTLSATSTGTISSGASIAFLANATSVSTASAIYDAGDLSVAGNINTNGKSTFGGGTTIGVAGTIVLGGGQIITANNASGAEIAGGAASSTVPTLIPNRGSTTTGIGAQASGNISAIIAGAEAWRFTSTGPQAVTLPTNAAENAVCTTAGAGETLSTAAAAVCSGVSDARLKHDIKPIGSVLFRIMKLTPDRWRYDDGIVDSGHLVHYGLTAQDVESAFPAKDFPDLVAHNKDGTPHAYAWDGFTIAMLTKAVQEEQHEIELLYLLVAVLVVWNIWLTVTIRRR